MSFLFCFQATVVSVLGPDYTLPFKSLPLPPHLFILFSSPQGFFKHSTTESKMRILTKSTCTGFSKRLSFLVNHKIIFHSKPLNSICYLLVPLNLFPGIWVISIELLLRFPFLFCCQESWVLGGQYSSYHRISDYTISNYDTGRPCLSLSNTWKLVQVSAKGKHWSFFKSYRLFLLILLTDNSRKWRLNLDVYTVIL